jgi:hypothetical protein
MGPVEFLAVEFPGNHFTGEIMPELKRVVENGTIRVIDLTFIRKDAEGKIESVELTELGEDEAAQFDPLVGELTGLLSPSDVEKMGGALANNSSAVLLVFEHTWATELQNAVVRANGRLMVQERIPRETVDAALAAA